ncbi:MAG: DMT family transporter [Burkholderiales bacterium]
MRRPTALVALHSAVALFGFAGLFGRWIELAPSGIVLGRTLVAAVALAAVALASGGLSRPRAGLAANGAILAIHWWTFFAAIRSGGVAIGLIGFASFPLFTLALERATGQRVASRRDGAVAALVVAGLLLVAPRLDPHDAVVRGLGWGVVSGATFAWLAVRNRRYAADHSPLAIALWQNAFAAACLAPWVLVAPPDGAIDARTIGLLLALGLLCTALAHTLFIASLASVSAHVASVAAALEPVYGIALAALLLAERPTGAQIAGCALLVAAAVLAARGATSSSSPDDAARMR